jgi:hypothetical protein
MNQFTQEAVHEEMLNIWRRQHKSANKIVFKQLKDATWIVYEDLWEDVTITVSAHVRIRLRIIRVACSEIIFPTNDWTIYNGRKIECKIGKCYWDCSRWAIFAEYK